MPTSGNADINLSLTGQPGELKIIADRRNNRQATQSATRENAMDRQSLVRQLIRCTVHSAVFSMLGLLAFDAMGLVSVARADDESERKTNAQQVTPDGKPRPPNVVLILADDK